MSEQQRYDSSATSRFDAILTDAQVASRGLDADDIATINALPASSALLIALEGPNVGARFLLNADVVSVGRHPSSDIFLDDVTVSRKHASFIRDGQRFLVRDEHSLNGTYVNMELHDEVELSDGDQVRIGKFQLTFYSSPQGTR